MIATAARVHETAQKEKPSAARAQTSARVPWSEQTDSTQSFDDMYKDKHALTRLAREYLADHNFVYPNGARAPFGNDLAEAVQKIE